jgi:Spy/CpxP family protein refolding chaperone
LSRLKLFIVLGFSIMFVAGVEVGRSHTSISSLQGDWHRLTARVSGQPPVPPATQPSKPESPHLLFGQIKLTALQDDQIHKIFHEAHARTDVLGHQFRDFDRIRDEDIQSILDPLQLAEYDAILQERDARVNALRTEISTAMEKAGKDVRAILNSDQQKH